ncbi:hypothetical protein [Nocardiopsis dassonvillei]|uniref:Uncharacterized protein n=1 Tax=Nocardiopsis dassonvillei (strain ATCC 23218 / DSM 43111 / CIP 107115 / JCM 7437 / KCTC 9190 / NBRC 14626 / NCTC 10488 / NRRL B-5397 / IMRU 509) TaxID=446468 RepID=D7B9G4_NOCDD|nr:hypothetical protein [Nocardiopsis dassonvillei]ADH70822.1 hypothetical protein Ndas_5443 [Nocardiopsis dassonvillei subsp. dassonvillei DSM 43111]NKY78064.1 hypothetical protein [Nocardiopsis dassonvillei]VEI91032.1 Uncharacterised protein [Nocardiopsis dassonvillei]
MRQFSAAALIRALGTVKALFAPPRGRHSTGGRRRRSTRVRRYVPVPDQVRAPVEATTPPARTDRAPERPERPGHPERPAAPGSVPAAAPAPATAPCLAPPSVRFPAEDIALVRPYYAAREQARAEARAGTREPGAARARREITIRLDQRPGTNTPFSGDLLATDSGPVPARVPAAASTKAPVPVLAQAFGPGPAPVPAPRPPSPACEDSEDWRAFTRLARVWLDQQQQRAERTQRAQQSHQPRTEHHRQAVPA